MVSFGQMKEGLELCILSQELSNKFSNSTFAEEALDKILSVVSLAKNFTLVPCDKINNAEAWSYKGERYILYDKDFMEVINSETNNWSNLTILAHEVGHHLNNHTIDLTMLDIVSQKSKELRRKQELEADEFAGNIMAKLGAPLNEVLKIGKMFSDEDDTYATHPSRSKRIASLTKGYNEGRKVSREKIIYVESKKGINKTLIKPNIEVYNEWGKKIRYPYQEALERMKKRELDIFKIKDFEKNNNMFLKEVVSETSIKIESKWFNEIVFIVKKSYPNKTLQKSLERLHGETIKEIYEIDLKFIGNDDFNCLKFFGKKCGETALIRSSFSEFDQSSNAQIKNIIDDSQINIYYPSFTFESPRGNGYLSPNGNFMNLYISYSGYEKVSDIKDFVEKLKKGHLLQIKIDEMNNHHPVFKKLDIFDEIYKISLMGSSKAISD